MLQFKIELPQEAAGWFTQMSEGQHGIVLRRGWVMRGSALHRWCGTASADARTLRIHLFNDNNVEAAAWTVTGAVPIRFLPLDDGATDQVAVEELELRYDSMTTSSS